MFLHIQTAICQAMDRDRYLPNPYEDYDGSELLENGQLKAQLRQNFVLNIAAMIKFWEDHFVFDQTDTSIYTGAAGAALLYMKVFETNLEQELNISSQELVQKLESLVDRCLKYPKKNRFTFLCGGIGPLTVKALLCSLRGQDYQTYLKEICNISRDSIQDPNLPNEILFGRAGILYALLLIRSKLDHSDKIITDELIREVLSTILNCGQNTAKQENSHIPLVYYWHEKAYIGAAHGYAGILYMLLEARSYLTYEELSTLVKPTIDFVANLQFCRNGYPESGNFPSSLRNPDDKLLHWCHGSPGIIHLLTLSYQVFHDVNYLNAALKSGEDLWRRGLLKKGRPSGEAVFNEYYSTCHQMN